jgi:site-specific DNA-methyltransferase (adenine-specific)
MGKERHNHQIKPVALFEYLIKTYTNEGDLVLDNCAGSGTTGVACKNLNRNFILIEKEPEYCKIAQARINSLPKPLL